MSKVKVIGNTQVGTDSIEHLIGKTFDIYSRNEEEVIVIHEGGKLPLIDGEYEIID